MARTTNCEWSQPCLHAAKPGSAYCEEHHARVHQPPKPAGKRIGIGPLTNESIRRAQARRKVKLGRG